jgi:lipopolysaccharide/colanic/teichoic acid biosynthesis glycosyltransferase
MLPGGRTWRQANGIPAWKRILDLGFIFLLSPALLLFGAAVAIVVKLGSPGPALFRQKRVGYRGTEFTCLKFRTMLADAETESHRQHTQNLIKSKAPMVKLDARKDPRLVPLGSMLRATGLDELPQLINVLRGEMSLVGPRPCIPYEFELYEPWQRQRFNAAPGLTGLWQVSGKNHTTFEQMVRMDITYAERLSFWLDLKIILKTLPAVWGQYSELRETKRPDSLSSERELTKSLQTYL